MPRAVSSFRALAMLALVAGCQPDVPVPTQVMALVLGSNGRYEPKSVTLKTITDPYAVSGTAATLVGGARVVLDGADPVLAVVRTEDELRDALLKQKGAPPRANYFEQDGVLWPADFHSWNMITTYYNFEKAVEYFTEVTLLTPRDVHGATVFYFPDFIDAAANSTQPQTDNAIWFSPVQGFLILPFKDFQLAPLSTNAAIVAHEFSHRVFNRLAYKGASIPEGLGLWSGGNGNMAVNVLRSYDEGLADYHAFGTTCRADTGCSTRFLAPSLGDDLAETAARDLALPDRCLTADLKRDLEQMTAEEFMGRGKQYQVGTVLATALYQAGQRTSKTALLQRSVIAAYANGSNATPGFQQLISQKLQTPDQFTFALLANAILQNIPDASLREAVCSEFMDHLKIVRDELPACPPSTVGGTTCG
jgi:hypothetical protein